MRWKKAFRREPKTQAQPSRPCAAYQQSDEMVCAACGLRWDVNDSDPPTCQRTGKTAKADRT